MVLVNVAVPENVGLPENVPDSWPPLLAATLVAFTAAGVV